jgi:hypothetical protein
VEEAVMESTAQYWRSVWLELEPHMRLHLAQRLIADELILSFVPDPVRRKVPSRTKAVAARKAINTYVEC